ncbi:HNH endonuclease [Methylomonas sp. CM2]|uniref:HNH endonuclease n=1 Tax=Methylomonas sp. CM2 TaxID=3417647 RepID=UPI003CF16E8E
MPVAAKRPCRHSGCRMLVSGRDGFCDLHRAESHRQQKQTVTIDYKERNRFYQRKAWKELRARRLSIEPLCRKCASRGVVVEGSVVDHVEPFDSINDPRALDLGNTQTLCESCHNSKTRYDRPRGG